MKVSNYINFFIAICFCLYGIYCYRSIQKGKNPAGTFSVERWAKTPDFSAYSSHKRKLLGFFLLSISIMVSLFFLLAQPITNQMLIEFL